MAFTCRLRLDFYIMEKPEWFKWRRPDFLMIHPFLRVVVVVVAGGGVAALLALSQPPPKPSTFPFYMLSMRLA